MNTMNFTNGVIGQQATVLINVQLSYPLFINKANLRDLVAATGLAILLK